MIDRLKTILELTGFLVLDLDVVVDLTLQRVILCAPTLCTTF
jgi:hypothetical protein